MSALDRVGDLEAELRNLASVERAQGGAVYAPVSASQPALELVRRLGSAQSAANAMSRLLEVLQRGGETALPGLEGAVVRVRRDAGGRLVFAHVEPEPTSGATPTEVETWGAQLGLPWAPGTWTDGQRSLKLEEGTP